jgi:hypothetical protein
MPEHQHHCTATSGHLLPGGRSWICTAEGCLAVIDVHCAECNPSFPNWPAIAPPAQAPAGLTLAG